jgi:hypothetical protein
MQFTDIEGDTYYVVLASGLSFTGSKSFSHAEVDEVSWLIKYDPEGYLTSEPYRLVRGPVVLQDGTLFWSEMLVRIRPGHGDFQKALISLFQTKENMFGFMQTWNNDQNRFPATTQPNASVATAIVEKHLIDIPAEQTRDTDGDGVPDWDEVFGGSDYLDPESTPEHPGGEDNEDNDDNGDDNNNEDTEEVELDTGVIELLLCVLIFLDCIGLGINLWRVFSSSAWRGSL